jgi:hypothetical protein
MLRFTYCSSCYLLYVYLLYVHNSPYYTGKVLLLLCAPYSTNLGNSNIQLGEQTHQLREPDCISYFLSRSVVCLYIRV